MAGSTFTDMHAGIIIGDHAATATVTGMVIITVIGMPAIIGGIATIITKVILRTGHMAIGSVTSTRSNITHHTMSTRNAITTSGTLVSVTGHSGITKSMEQSHMS